MLNLDLTLDLGLTICQVFVKYTHSKSRGHLRNFQSTISPGIYWHAFLQSLTCGVKFAKKYFQILLSFDSPKGKWNVPSRAGAKQPSLPCYAVAAKVTDRSPEGGILAILRGNGHGALGASCAQCWFELKSPLCLVLSLLTCISALLGIAGTFLKTWVMGFTGPTLSPERHLCPQVHILGRSRLWSPPESFRFPSDRWAIPGGLELMNEELVA